MSLKAIGQAPSPTAGVDQDFIRTSGRTYLAIFDQADDEFYVTQHCTFAVNGAHPSDTLQLVTEIQVSQVKPTVGYQGATCSLWKIDVSYGPWNPLEHSYDGNPLHLPVRVRLDNATAEKAAFVDVDGDPIVNAAGDPFDPPLMREFLTSALTVRRNEAPSSVNLPTLAALSNTINLAAFNGFPAKTVKLKPIKLPDVEYSQVTGQFYYPMEYQFDINYDTWVAQVLNAGFRQLAAGNLVKIMIDGQDATTPVPLDEAGHAILDPSYLDSGGDTPEDPDPEGDSDDPAGGGQPPLGGTGTGSSGSNLVMLAFDMTRVADFSVLNMANLFTLPPA